MIETASGMMDRPISGTGIGLRHRHLDEIDETRPNVSWFEILADNHMEAGGPITRKLLNVRRDYSFTMHCVGMSLGTMGPLDLSYLEQIRLLANRYEVQLVSDHLCFTHNNDRHYHELLPLPYTEEALQHLSKQIIHAQDVLQRHILVENVSSYFTYTHSTIAEWEFLAELATRADCHILLDLNNIYVNAFNHGFNTCDYLHHFPYDRVKEIHLAGFDHRVDYLFDSHGNRVSDDVWDLFRQVMSHSPHIPALIEWDNDIPEFSVLLEEADKAELIRLNDHVSPQQRARYEIA